MAIREQIDPKIYENELSSLHRELDAVMAEKDELERQLRQAKEIIFRMTAERYGAL